MVAESESGGTVLLLFFTAALVLGGGMTWVYAERAMNACAFLTSVLGFTVGLCTVALVPYDVWAAQMLIAAEGKKSQGIDVDSISLPISPSRIKTCWEAMYLLTVLLCYFVIPLLMEFETAGDFRFRARLKTSLRRNCVWYVVYIILGILLLIFIPNTWLTADGHQQGKLSSFWGFCIAASNTFGLLVLTILMGFGLVGLPRNLWLASDTSGKLRNLYERVTAQNAARLAAQSELQEVIAEVAKEVQSVEARMRDADATGNPFVNKAPLRRAATILQKTLERSQEINKTLAENAAPVRQQQSPRSSTNSTSSTASTSPLNPRSFLGYVKGLTEARSLAPANSVSDRRQEIRERREDLGSFALSGLLGSSTEAGIRRNSSDEVRAEAERLSETPETGRNGILGSFQFQRRPSAELCADMRHLTKLHSALKFVTLEARRAWHHWDTLVQKCALIEDLDNLEPESATDTPGVAWSVRRQLYEASWSYTRSSYFCCSGCCLQLLRERHFVREGWRKAVLFWFRKCRPRAFKFASCCTATLSALIVLGQLTMFSQSLWFFSLFGVLVHHANCNFLATIGICVVPLSYMAFTASWGIFRLRISGWYGVYPNHNTDSSSLLWCTMAITRICVPLCYHFLGVLHITERTSFEDFMQPMQIVPVFGKDFNRYFPMFVALLCACNIGGIYSGIVRRLGLGMLSTSSDGGWGEASGPVEEGKELVQQERRRRFEKGLHELQRHGEAPETLRPLGDTTPPTSTASLAT